MPQINNPTNELLWFLGARDSCDHSRKSLTLVLDCRFKHHTHNLTDEIFPSLSLASSQGLLLYNSQFGELAQLVRATES